MDNLSLSPNGSINEVQAWNNLMDTVVAFIKTCIHLMNIITNKMRAEYRETCPKEESNLSEITEGSEPECQSCRPRSPCGRERGAHSRGILGTTFTAEKSAPQRGGDDKCTCAEIDATPLEEMKNRFRSSRNKSREGEDEEHPREEHSFEIICGWDATLEHRVTMVRDIVEKLGNAQQEILHLQEALVELQKIETSKRMGPNGGPNPEALCRKIMKHDAGMAVTQHNLDPLRGRPYPTGASSIFPPGREPQQPYQGGFDVSMRSGMRTTVMPPISSGGARGFNQMHTFTPCSPPFMETPSESAMDMDRRAISSQSRIETYSTSNVFPPRGCLCYISSLKSPSGPYRGECDSSMGRTSMRSPIRSVARLAEVGRFSPRQKSWVPWRGSRVDPSTPSQTSVATPIDRSGFSYHPFTETPCAPNVFPSGVCLCHIASIRSTLEPYGGGFDSSMRKSGVRTPVVPRASSRREQESYSVNTSTVSSPPYMETSSQPAVDIYKTAPSSQSSLETPSTSNVLPPKDSSMPWSDKRTPVRPLGGSRVAQELSSVHTSTPSTSNVLPPRDSSMPWSDKRTPVRPLGGSRGAQEFSSVHTSTPIVQPFMKISPESAKEMEKTGPSTESHMEISSIPNIFSPRVFPSDISPIRSSSEAYGGEFDSSVGWSGKRVPVMPLSRSTVGTSMSSSLLAIKSSAREDKDTTPDAVYWSRVAKFGDPDVEDEQRETNVRPSSKSNAPESPPSGE